MTLKTSLTKAFNKLLYAFCTVLTTNDGSRRTLKKCLLPIEEVRHLHFDVLGSSSSYYLFITFSYVLLLVPLRKIAHHILYITTL